jgi:hypothetical protein
LNVVGGAGKYAATHVAGLRLNRVTRSFLRDVCRAHRFQ